MKILSRIIMSVFLFVFAFSTNAFAATEQKHADDTKVTQENQIKETTPEDYYKMIADARNISIKDAEKMTKEIIKNHQEKIRQARKSSQDGDVVAQVISWGSSYSDAYGGKYTNVVVYKRYDAGGGMVVEVGVPGLLYTYGSYAREFVSIDSAACYAKPVMSGKYTYDPFTKTASLTNNEVHLNTRGNVEVSTTVASSIGISIPELIDYGFEASTTTVYRKTITISHIEKLY